MYSAANLIEISTLLLHKGFPSLSGSLRQCDWNENEIKKHLEIKRDDRQAVEDALGSGIEISSPMLEYLFTPFDKIPLLLKEPNTLADTILGWRLSKGI